MVAGHETTAHTLTFTMAYLALNPDVQQKMFEEVDRVLGGRDPTYSDVDNLIYCKCVFKETLRLMPPVASIPKKTTAPMELCGYTLPADTKVYLNAYVMQRDPKHFPEPERFNPDRFDTRISAPVSNNVFFPFSLGQRSCIGMGFAQIEAVTVLAMIAQHFTLHVPSDVDKAHYLDFKCMLTMQPVNPINVIMKRRVK